MSRVLFIGGRLVAVLLLVSFLAACDQDDAVGGGSSAQTAPDRADLTITSATVQRVSDNSCSGAATCLIVTVANRGARDATGLQDGCFTDSFGAPRLVASFALGGSVPARSTITFRSGWSDLDVMVSATFDLVCEVDAVDRIIESNEANNTYSTTISF